MTKADIWRKIKPEDWSDIYAYLDDVQKLDRQAYFKFADGEPIVVFSDGSTHNMRGKA
jgi:hypothetical protein